MSGNGKLDAKVKADWLAALRSGKYQQCKGALHNGVGYCCLGVRAHIEGRDIVARAEDGRFDNTSIYVAYREDRTIEQKIDALIDMNDRGESFATIADFIEENL